MPINQGIQNFGRLLEPGLRKIFFETYKEKAEQYSQYMNVLSSKKAIETDARMGGFSMWNTKASLDTTEYEDLTGLDTVQYKHVTYSKGFQTEKELIDDEQYNQLQKASAALARAARATIETNAIIPLNNAFTATATNWKGEALIAMTHTRLDGQTGGTQNMLDNNPVLSEPNVELMMKLARSQADERGLKIQMHVDTMLVPPALEFTANKIAESTQTPGNNWNDINPVKGKFKVVVLDYLSSSTAWYMVDSTMNPLNFFWRERLNFKSTNDFDTDIAKYKGRMRFSYGWTDHRGIVGSRGDGLA